MNFDKFMDEILVKEVQKKKNPQKTETGQRTRVKLYQEKPSNRTKWVKK